MANFKVNEKVEYIGVDDKDLDLFESQYPIPNGISYNSYLIKDEKTVLMDSVDARKTDEWLQNLEESLGDRDLDYVVVLHMEPDHSSSLKVVLDKYPGAKIIGNAKTFQMMAKYFDIDIKERKEEVRDGQVISFGEASLTFMMAPMIHWPEVMFAYEASTKTLFSADAFGKFGALDTDEDWACEARRYYFNIVGKYGVQVQGALMKLKQFNIQAICPLHGPILDENLDYYIGKYKVWSSFEPEDEGVMIACASIHGNTKKACHILEEKLLAAGIKNVAFFDLTRDDMSEAVEDAFRYDRMVLASSTYDGGIFPPMEDFLHHLKAKGLQKRKIAFVENGSWAPASARLMMAIVEPWKNITLCENKVTIHSTLNESGLLQIDKLVEELC